MENMEMPTPCQKCGETFDLNDGCGSEKWYPNTVICKNCHEKESEELEKDEEIADLENIISESEFSIKEAKTRLKELGEVVE